jgi:TRAP transporter TAXI family solute receptor
MNVKLPLATLLIMAISLIIGCTPSGTVPSGTQAQADVKEQLVTITLGALPLGSTYYAVGLGLGTAWEKKIPGYKVQVEPLASIVVMMQRIKEGKVDIGFTNVPSLVNASKGLQTFKDVGPVKIRTVAALWKGDYAFWTGKNTGIRSITDLAGKRVQWYSPGVYMSNVISEGLLEYYGIKDRLAKLTAVEDTASIDSIIEGRLDSYFSMAGSELTRLEAQVGMQPVEMPNLDKAVEYLNTKTRPSFKSSVLRKERYGLSSDIPTVGTPVYLLAASTVPDDVVYNLLKSMLDNTAEFSTVHPDLKYLSVEAMVSYPHAIPWHPGAIKCFKKKGLWTSAQETSNHIAMQEFK